MTYFLNSHVEYLTYTYKLLRLIRMDRIYGQKRIRYRALWFGFEPRRAVVIGTCIVTRVTYDR